jgi:hypothetical protein
MYTALVVTRMIFDLLAARTKVETLRMLEVIATPRLDFLKISKWVCGALSLIVILGSWGVFASKGKANFGVDFTGRLLGGLQFAEKVPMEQVRDVLEGGGVQAHHPVPEDWRRGGRGQPRGAGDQGRLRRRPAGTPRCWPRSSPSQVPAWSRKTTWVRRSDRSSSARR